MSLLQKSCSPLRLLRRFAGDDKGNVAVMFSIAVLPILSFVGAAVDYTRASNARTVMQSALDSAALMVSKDLSSGAITSTEVSAKAASYFNALYTNTNAYGITVSATYTPKNAQGMSTIAATATGSVDTEFMKVAGFPKLDFNTASTTSWGGTRLRVAMALDVTGSMNDDGKLAEMKKAAKKLIDTLKVSSTIKDDVYISIIPFNTMVNVDNDNKTATWLDWDTDYGSCSRSKYTTKSDCVTNGRIWTASGVNSWKGCVTDRDEDYDTAKDAPNVNTPETLFLAKSYSACPSSILQMTSVFDSNESDTSTNDNTLKGKINNLYATGNTNQSIGMQWAWMMLQPTVPFVTPPKDNLYKYTDAIILLSDGENTQSRKYTSASQIDARQKILCTNIKKPNLITNKPDTVIYTIQVNTDGDPESAVLKACASPEGGFFPASSSASISSAFNSIGTSLSKLRVAQ